MEKQIVAERTEYIARKYKTWCWILRCYVVVFVSKKQTILQLPQKLHEKWQQREGGGSHSASLPPIRCRRQRRRRHHYKNVLLRWPDLKHFIPKKRGKKDRKKQREREQVRKRSKKTILVYTHSIHIYYIYMYVCIQKGENGKEERKEEKLSRHARMEINAPTDRQTDGRTNRHAATIFMLKCVLRACFTCVRTGARLQRGERTSRSVWDTIYLSGCTHIQWRYLYLSFLSLLTYMPWWFVCLYVCACDWPVKTSCCLCWCWTVGLFFLFSSPLARLLHCLSLSLDLLGQLKTFWRKIYWLCQPELDGEILGLFFTISFAFMSSVGF